MGVHKLWALLREDSPQAFSVDIRLSGVGHGRKIAVDLSFLLHEFGQRHAKDVMIKQIIPRL